MKGLTQSVIEELREESQALIHRMLDQGTMPDEVRRAVYRLSGERVSLWTLTQYARRYAERRKDHGAARLKTDDFIRLAGKRGVKISDLLRAALIEGLLQARRNGQLRKTDVLKLEEAERKRREFELKQTQARRSARHKKRELDLKERQAQLAEQRLQDDREKAQATIEKLERKAHAGQSLTPEDIRRIREIYGLYDEWQAERDDIETNENNGSLEENETEEQAERGDSENGEA